MRQMLLLGLFSLGGWAMADPGARPPVDFQRDIAPLLKARCLECHGPDKQRGGYRLDDRVSALEAGDSGSKGIVPGKSAESALIGHVTGKVGKRMPPKGDPLPPEQIALLARWIDAGASYPGTASQKATSSHWSLQPVGRPSVPGSLHARVLNPVDAFLQARLDKEGLVRNPPADRATLARRLSLDLTGLPLSPERVKAFVADNRSDAVLLLVRELMALPAHGERMARPWLDLARYADSKGYGSDPLRPYAWRYRDWVIDAFNRNLPYDQFVIEQLAGDLLPGATLDQKLATAFHRNTMTNTEGGTDREEFRTAAVKDRVDTTAQVFLGLTLGCAKCHTHKFDPLTQKEYYQFYAVFNQTADNDNSDDQPRLPTPTNAQAALKTSLNATLGALDKDSSRLVRFDTAAFQAFARAAIDGEKLWKPVVPTAVAATGGAILTMTPEGQISGAGEAAKSTYTLTLPPGLAGTQSLRLEVLPDDKLPARGPGRSEGGNFVLDRISLTEQPEPTRPAEGRFVRLELPGAGRFLHVAEVQAFLGTENLARKGKATQSSTAYGAEASRAIDGNTDGLHENGSVTHTGANDSSLWWEVDLGKVTRLDRVVVFNRTGPGMRERLDGVVVKLLDDKRATRWETRLAKAPERDVSLPLGGNGPRPIAVVGAKASFEQPQFTAEVLLKGESGKGWAVGTAAGKPAMLEIRLARPLTGTAVTVALRQDYGTRHLIGRFRLLARVGEPALPLPDASLLKTLATSPDQWNQADRARMVALWLPLSPEGKEIAGKREETVKKLAELEKQVVSTPVMEELPEGKKRKTRLLVKGNFLTPGDEVAPGLLAAVGPRVEGAPDRLKLARWIVSAESPLAARVQVNRLWALVFGRGLVETEEDFGLMGTKPSHPELLDWLASEFMRLKWDNRAILELLVTSATYGQTSTSRPDLLEKDSGNLLLARFPRRRLEAEAVRDQALAVSGLLSPKIGGESVYPPQPDGLWQAAFNGERTYPTSMGEEAHRRGIYTFWRRTVPPPGMQAFDAPSRESCTIRRFGSNTPLQAFVTLNDPVFVEAAQYLAARMAREAGTTDARLSRGFLLCLGRDPEPAELATLRELHDKALKDLPAGRAVQLAGKAPWPEAMPPADRAALFSVANILLNLDSFLTRN